jgi:hypothetical protein
MSLDSRIRRNDKCEFEERCADDGSLLHLRKRCGYVQGNIK